MQEKDFWERSLIYSADTLWVKNFIEIALCRSVSEVNMFLCFMQKFKIKLNDFWKKLPVESPNTLRVENFVEIALSHSVSKINKKIYAIILGKYSNCNSFGVTMDLLNSRNFEVAITQLFNVQQV